MRVNSTVMVSILTCSKQRCLIEAGVEGLKEALQDPDSITWVDFDNPTPEDVAILSDVFAFHPLAIEDCLGFTPHPKIDDYGDYLYIVIHGINSDALKTGGIKTHDLDIFLGKNFVVTFHKGFFRSVEAVIERCRKNPSLMGHKPELLAHKIVDTLVDNYLPIMDDLGDEIDALEKEVFTRPKRDVPQKLLKVKKDILNLRRTVYPQREIIRQLSRGEYDLIGKEATPHFKDIFDNMFMISELLESYRDSVSSAMDVYLSNVSNRLGEVMKVLTVIATIMMPLTLITGIFGMNFEYIPLLRAPEGFALIMIGMLMLAGVMLWAFKKRGWW